MRSIAFTGDRQWSNESVVFAALNRLQPGDRVIVGDARGLDTIAYRLARDPLRQLVIDGPHVADWKTLGRGAGPVRNRAMLDRLPDEVWAFHDDLAHSKGTANMIQQAERRGIPVRRFTSADSARPRRRRTYGDGTRASFANNALS